MLKKYTFSFYCLLSVLVFTVPINCRRLSRYTRQVSRRQEGPGPDGPPEGPPVGPPPGGPPDGPPEGLPEGPLPEGMPPGIPDVPGRPGESILNPVRPKEPDQEETTDDGDLDKPIVTARYTELPQEAVDDALVLDYGRYTTLSFHYEQRQWMFSAEYDRCYDDYIKCYTTLVVPMPVCIMYSTRYVKTYSTYCDVYFENCTKRYRYWRIVGYGKCIVGFFGYPFLEDYTA